MSSVRGNPYRGKVRYYSRRCVLSWLKLPASQIGKVKLLSRNRYTLEDTFTSNDRIFFALYFEKMNPTASSKIELKGIPLVATFAIKNL